MSTAEYIVDITMENAKSILIDRSFETPVVIDFWADWCEPCKDLMPILEKLANEYQGAFTLARVNADAMQPLAGQFGIRSLPTVMIMQNGQPVDGFAGAQPEGAIREILEKYLPKAEDIKLNEAKEFLEANDLANALNAAKEAWDIDSKRTDIHFMYIRALVANNRWEEAKKLLNETKLEDQQAEYHELLSQVELLEKASDTPQMQALEKRIEQNPEDDELKVQLAVQYTQANRNEDALELLFSMLSKNLDSANGEAKQTFLDIVNTLSGDPIASKFRRRYFSLLY
ncbi:tetratricopeptide repeat protein [Celerinatantimonas sp. MCCC 1A17872]|uniref:tetratricopeptide repeat protein n=1 Tax=Celerinatantimonas sp. MCCC 1A17872 TaxID=3177514 RepID=UPI0038BFEB93